MKRCFICGHQGDDSSTVCEVCGNPYINIPDLENEPSEADEHMDEVVELPEEPDTGMAEESILSDEENTMDQQRMETPEPVVTEKPQPESISEEKPTDVLPGKEEIPNASQINTEDEISEEQGVPMKEKTVYDQGSRPRRKDSDVQSQEGAPQGKAPYGQGGQPQERVPYTQGGQPQGRAPYNQGGQLQRRGSYNQEVQSQRRASYEQGGQPQGRAPYNQGGQPQRRGSYNQEVQSQRRASYEQGGQPQRRGSYNQEIQSQRRGPYNQQAQPQRRMPYEQGGQPQGRPPRGQQGQPQGRSMSQPQPNGTVFRQGAQGKRVMQEARKALHSPVFLILTVLYTAFIAASIASAFMQDLSFTQILQMLTNLNPSNEIMLYTDKVVGLLSRFDSGAMVVVLVSRIPDAVLCIGFWITYLTSGARRKNVSGGGFLLARIVLILKFLAACILLLVCLLLAVTFTVSAWVSGQQMTKVTAVIFLVAVIVLTMMVIMFFFCCLHTVKVCRLNAVKGEDAGKVSVYAAVITILAGLISVISLLTSVVNVEIAGIVSAACSIGWMVLLGIWIFVYRSKVKCE